MVAVVVLVAVLVAIAALVAGGSKSTSSGRIRGALVRPPLSKPDFTLTDTSGQTFSLRANTADYLTLLYFGYTHCPDVCPTHMANIAAALHHLPGTVTSRIKVVFVTTDPARDSGPVIRDWLSHFDPTFIGLTGTAAQVQTAEAASGMAPSTVQFQGGGNYAVDHAAQVEAFTTDNLSHVVYPGGYQQADWANDLPLLVKGWKA